MKYNTLNLRLPVIGRLIRKIVIMKVKSLIIILISTIVLLLIPLIAMQFSDAVNWTLSDFVVAGVLFCGAGIMCDFVLRKLKKSDYRSVIILALILIFLLIWAELAVGIFGTPLAGN